MKPAWDKLMADFEGHATALVADVDCTAAGEDLCSAQGVKGYPTIKHGDPNNLEDYEGGRDYEDLKKFADENLKPVCGPANLDLCDDDAKAAIEKIQALSDEDLDKAIADKEAENTAAEEHFTSEVEKLQKKYEELMAEKDAKQAEVKKSGLGTMKAVKASRK